MCSSPKRVKEDQYFQGAQIMNDIKDQSIGGFGNVPASTARMLSYVLETLEKNNPHIDIKNGQTALFWHLISIIDDTLVITIQKELWILTHPKMIQEENRMMEYVHSCNSKETFIAFCKEFFAHTIVFEDEIKTEKLVEKINKEGYIVLMNGKRL